MNDIRKYLSEIGKKGAAATNSKLTANQRAESARKAAEARWAKLEKNTAETKALVAEGTKKLKKLTQTMERNKKARAKKKAAK